MTANTPLEQALEAWNHNRRDEEGESLAEWYTRQQRVDDAVALGETGVFSNNNIALIVGLDVGMVGRLTGKTDKTGGRFNPEGLPLILDLSLAWRAHKICDAHLVRAIVGAGVSPSIVAKLTGISRGTLYSRLRGSDV
jgi:hypothetical protein